MRLSWRDDWPGAIALAAASIMIAPLWIVDSPGMPDYPAHLATFFLLAGGTRDPVLGHFYHIEWAAIPNLAFELLVPAMGHMMSLVAATKVLLSASVGLWTAGPALINRVLYGRFGVATLGAVFFAYNDNFMWGFFNYYFAAGLAFAAFAGWIASERWNHLPRIAVFMLATVVIYFSHVFGAALLLLMIACYEVGRLRERGDLSVRSVFSALRPIAVIALPVAIAFVFLKPAGSDSHISFKILETLHDRYEAAIAVTFDQPGFVTLAALIAVLALSFWRGWIFLHARLVPLLVALVVLAILAPEEAMGGWGVDLRLPAVLGAMIFASARLRLPVPGEAALAIAVLLGVTWNSAALAGSWRYFDRQFQEFRKAGAGLPRGVRLMTVLDGDAIGKAPDQPYWHVAEFEVIDRAAFTPLLFTTKGQHVVRLNPGVERAAASSAQQGSPPDVTELDDLAAGSVDGDWDIAHVFPYLLRFPCKYDEVVLVHLSGKRSPVSDVLHQRYRGSFFSLYDIDRGSCPTK
jgi:hypothetical protein